MKKNIIGVILMLTMAVAIIIGFWELKAYAECKEMMDEYGYDTEFCDYVFASLKNIKFFDEYYDDYCNMNGENWACRWNGVHSFQDFEDLYVAKAAAMYYYIYY